MARLPDQVEAAAHQDFAEYKCGLIGHLYGIKSMDDLKEWRKKIHPDKEPDKYIQIFPDHFVILSDCFTR